MDFSKIAVCCIGTALALSVGAGVEARENGEKCANICLAQASNVEVNMVVRADEATVKIVDKELLEAYNAGRQLTPSDKKWLELLRKYWGRDTITVPNLDNLPATRTVKCRLTVDSINGTPGALRALALAWNVMKEATKDEARTFVGADYRVPCYNESIFAKMRKDYSSKEFQSLVDLLREHKVFELKVNEKTGLVVTSDIPDTENHEMASRQWVTDTVRTGRLQRVSHPEAYKKVLNTLAAFYTTNTEQLAFDRCIGDPKIYRDGGPEEGVAHIFYPNTLERDKGWANNKRLESHGLALQALCEGIIANIDGEKWAIEEPSEAYVQAIANLVAYFIKIDYATAPSAGNWEETPFPGGLTWDTEAIRAALVTYKKLMTSSEFERSSSVRKFRQMIDKARYSSLVKDGAELNKAIVSGENRVRRTYMAESPGHREMDSSLVFLAASDLALDDKDALNGVSMYLKMLQKVEKKLVRDNGMIRYAPFYVTLADGTKALTPDSYLNFNYNIACDPQGKLNLEWKNILDAFGSKDASDPKVFMARASLATANTEAEWFMVSDLSKGYAHQALNVLRLAAKRLGRYDRYVKIKDLNERELQLFKVAYQGATRNINRSVARITGDSLKIKANGGQTYSWKVPEAWQCVSTLDSQKSYVPGINTPLTWAMVSLEEACQEYAQLLKCIER